MGGDNKELSVLTKSKPRSGNNVKSKNKIEVILLPASKVLLVGILPGPVFYCLF